MNPNSMGNWTSESTVQTAKTNLQNFYAKHRPRILKGAVVAGVLVATYYLGKTKGNTTIELFLNSEGQTTKVGSTLKG